MMSAEEVLTMKPGRELDAMVAEKVMGWTYGHPCPEGMDCLHWVDEKGKVRDYKPPQYSTDIAAAWEVVEEMQNNEWDFTLKNLVHKRKYEAIFGTLYNAFASTAPEAICKAAILAARTGRVSRDE